MSCGKLLKEGHWWHFCGETDMGQTMPVQCTECGGEYELASPDKQAEYEARKATRSVEGYFNLYNGEGSSNTIPYSIGPCDGMVWMKVREPEQSVPEEDEDDEPEAAGAWTYGGAPGVVTHLPCTHKPSWLKRKLGQWATGFKWEDYK